MHLRFLLPACVLAVVACGDSAIERQYKSLEHEQELISKEIGPATASADRAFNEATAAERQTGNSVAGLARCSAPKATFRPGAPLNFGPVRFKYKEKTFVLTETSPVDTAAWRCVQEAESSR